MLHDNTRHIKDANGHFRALTLMGVPDTRVRHAPTLSKEVINSCTTTPTRDDELSNIKLRSDRQMQSQDISAMEEAVQELSNVVFAPTFE